MASIDRLSPRHCLGTTARGRPCRVWAIKGSSYCLAPAANELAQDLGWTVFESSRDLQSRLKN